MSDSVGLGLIGCGQIADYHLRETQHDPRVRWVAVCDVRAEAAAERAEAYGVPGRYTEVEALLADPAVEAVVVATPPTGHVDHVVAAFEAGKHVLVEKPAALNTAEVQAMLAARGDRVGASCSCRFRSTHSARRAAEAIAAGELGALRRLSATALLPPPDSYDGTSPFFLHRAQWGGQGVLADWGVYDLDYLLGLCGWSLTPARVLAETRKLPAAYRRVAAPRNDVEVQVSALARFAGDTVLDYRRAVFFAGQAHNEWAIEGEEATLDLCMLPGTPQVILHRHTAKGVVSETLAETADSWSDVMAGPVLDFVGAILEARPPLTSLGNALQIQQLSDAIYASAAAGEAVEVG